MRLVKKIKTTKILLSLLAAVTAITLFVPFTPVQAKDAKDTNGTSYTVIHERVAIAPLNDTNTNSLEIVVSDEQGDWDINNRWNNSKGVDSGTSAAQNYQIPDVSAGNEYYNYLYFPGNAYASEPGVSSKDEALAQNVASVMQSSWDTVIGLIQGAGITVELADWEKGFIDNAEELAGGYLSAGSCTVNGHTLSWEPVQDDDDIKELGNINNSGVNKGTSVKNFAKFTIDGNNSVIVQFAVPKGYATSDNGGNPAGYDGDIQYAATNWHEVTVTSSDGAVTSYSPVPYVSMKGVAYYAYHMETDFNITVGQSSEKYLYADQSGFTKLFGSFFNTILKGLESALGITDIVTLVFNRGTRAGYEYGIMPYAAMRTCQVAYWLSLLVAVFVLFQAIYLCVLKRAAADISPAIRADFKEDLLRLLLVFGLEILFIPLFTLMCQANEVIVDLMSSMSSSSASAFSIGSTWATGFIVQFIVLALTVTINIKYMVRMISVAICFVSAPVAIATLAYDSKRQIFDTWLRELVANIFMQAFNAIMMWLLLGICNNVNSALLRICMLYSFIPLTKWFMEDLFGIKNLAGMAADQVDAKQKNAWQETKRRANNAFRASTNAGIGWMQERQGAINGTAAGGNRLNYNPSSGGKSNGGGKDVGGTPVGGTPVGGGSGSGNNAKPEVKDADGKPMPGGDVYGHFKQPKQDGYTLGAAKGNIRLRDKMATAASFAGTVGAMALPALYGFNTPGVAELAFGKKMGQIAGTRSQERYNRDLENKGYTEGFAGYSYIDKEDNRRYFTTDKKMADMNGKEGSIKWGEGRVINDAAFGDNKTEQEQNLRHLESMDLTGEWGDQKFATMADNPNVRMIVQESPELTPGSVDTRFLDVNKLGATMVASHNQDMADLRDAGINTNDVQHSYGMAIKDRDGKYTVGTEAGARYNGIGVVKKNSNDLVIGNGAKQIAPQIMQSTIQKRLTDSGYTETYQEGFRDKDNNFIGKGTAEYRKIKNYGVDDGQGNFKLNDGSTYQHVLAEADLQDMLSDEQFAAEYGFGVNDDNAQIVGMTSYGVNDQYDTVTRPQSNSINVVSPRATLNNMKKISGEMGDDQIKQMIEDREAQDDGMTLQEGVWVQKQGEDSGTFVGKGAGGYDEIMKSKPNQATEWSDGKGTTYTHVLAEASMRDSIPAQVYDNGNGSWWGVHQSDQMEMTPVMEAGKTAYRCQDNNSKQVETLAAPMRTVNKSAHQGKTVGSQAYIDKETGHTRVIAIDGMDPINPTKVIGSAGKR